MDTETTQNSRWGKIEEGFACFRTAEHLENKEQLTEKATNGFRPGQRQLIRSNLTAALRAAQPKVETDGNHPFLYNQKHEVNVYYIHLTTANSLVTQAKATSNQKLKEFWKAKNACRIAIQSQIHFLKSSGRAIIVKLMPSQVSSK